MDVDRRLPAAGLLLRLDKASLGLAHVAPISVGGLLVIRCALHLSKNPFSLAELLESSHELLHRFVGSRSNFDHRFSIHS